MSNSLTMQLRPRLQQVMRRDKVTVPHKVLEAAANRVFEDVVDGEYRGEFEILDASGLYCFDLSLELIYSPFENERGCVNGVRFFGAWCDVYDYDTETEYATDFTGEEFAEYLKC